MTKPNPTSSPEPVDYSVISAWTAAIVEGRAEEIRAVFRGHSALGPEIIWSPTVDNLIPAPLRFLFTYWSGLAGAHPVPLARQIDPLDMRPALGHVSLLDVVNGGRDFRYRLFGTVITAVSDFDMTGRLVSAFPSSAYIVEFYLASYAAMLRRSMPLLTVHTPPATIHTAAWHRLILPLTNDGGTIIRCLVGAVAVDRQGRPIGAAR